MGIGGDPTGGRRDWQSRRKAKAERVREAWTLARLVREAVESDGGNPRGSASGPSGGRRAIVSVVDLPGQAYGRLEETAAPCGPVLTEDPWAVQARAPTRS